MIEGKYIAQVEVNFEYDGELFGITFEELNERVTKGWLDRRIGEQIEQIFGEDNAKIIITRMTAFIKNSNEKEGNIT